MRQDFRFDPVKLSFGLNVFFIEFNQFRDVDRHVAALSFDTFGAQKMSSVLPYNSTTVLDELDITIKLVFTGGTLRITISPIWKRGQVAHTAAVSIHLFKLRVLARRHDSNFH